MGGDLRKELHAEAVFIGLEPDRLLVGGGEGVEPAQQLGRVLRGEGRRTLFVQCQSLGELENAPPVAAHRALVGTDDRGRIARG